MQLIDDIIREKTNSFAVGMVEYSSIQEFYEDVLKEFNRLTIVPYNLLEKCKRNPLYFYDKYVTVKQKPAEWSKDYDEENIQTRFAFYTYKDDPSTLYLSNVFVEEASRNHGFGTRILRAAEKVAETIGATTISLKVKQDSPANAWYRKNGYGYVVFEDGYDWLEKNLEYMKPNYNNLPIEQQMEAAMIAIKGEISSKSQEWSEEDENLDEAARDYGVRGNANGVGGEDYANDLAIAFKAGAQWMKEQLTVK